MFPQSIHLVVKVVFSLEMICNKVMKDRQLFSHRKQCEQDEKYTLILTSERVKKQLRNNTTNALGVTACVQWSFLSNQSYIMHYDFKLAKVTPSDV